MRRHTNKNQKVGVFCSVVRNCTLVNCSEFNRSVSLQDFLSDFTSFTFWRAPLADVDALLADLNLLLWRPHLVTSHDHRPIPSDRWPCTCQNKFSYILVYFLVMHLASGPAHTSPLSSLRSHCDDIRDCLYAFWDLLKFAMCTVTFVSGIVVVTWSSCFWFFLCANTMYSDYFLW